MWSPPEGTNAVGLLARSRLAIFFLQITLLMMQQV
jgi:hypothetical protein